MATSCACDENRPACRALCILADMSKKLADTMARRGMAEKGITLETGGTEALVVWYLQAGIATIGRIKQIVRKHNLRQHYFSKICDKVKK